MTRSSKGSALLNVPAPPGSKAGTSYARIIPAEELQDFRSWQPGVFGDAPVTARPVQARQPEPAGPTEADWALRIAEARKAGYEDGYRDGLKGLESFKQSHAEQMQAQNRAQLNGLIESFEQQWSALEETMAQSMARSAVSLARAVLRHELRTTPQTVVALAQEAVQAIGQSARRLELHLNPQDVSMVQHALGELLTSRSGRIVSDPTVGRGGCRVQSDVTTVDATLDSRWTEAAAAMGQPIPWDEPPTEPTP